VGRHGQECALLFQEHILWNQQAIASEVDSKIICWQHIRDLWDAMLAWYGCDGDWTKGGGFPGIHLNDVGRANLACRLSNSKKGSKNREKARHQVARLHARIANIREDALHKATSSIVHAPLTPGERFSLKTSLASFLPLPKTKAEQKKIKQQVKKLLHQTTVINAPLRPQVIVLEDLNVDGMKRNHKLARAVSDVGMAEFRSQVAYKRLWNGEVLLFADRFFPSSKKCDGCDWEWKDMQLSDRMFICQNPKCRFYLAPQDRDFNASENLAEQGYEYLRSLR
jgi:putative transposase